MKADLTIGLVAGRGELPFEVIPGIRAQGARAVVIALAGEAAPNLADLADEYVEIAAGQLGSIIQALTERGVSELVMAGKVGKTALFNGGVDPTFLQLLSKLPQKNDDAILLAIVEEFERHGMRVAKQTQYLEHLLAPVGTLFGEPTGAEATDLQLGFRMAKASGGLDIGQSVVVKSGVILAVEAIEGTDQAILRGGALGGPGAVVVKVSKPEQDERFDVPTVGLTTLNSMIEVQATVLGIEAGKTLMIQKEEMLKTAARNGIKIVSLQ